MLPEVAYAMEPYFVKKYGNASATYELGAEAKRAIELARESISASIHAKPSEIFFTSGGSEADNWAIKGMAGERKGLGRHVITTKIEHHAILHSCEHLERLGYKVSPKFDANRSDIVQTIEFGNSEDMIRYCKGIQFGSAVNSNCAPEPADMPGYTSKIIMASGSLTQGSSIELSCDGPIRPPYVAFMQGGLTYEYGKIGVMRAIQEMKN
jgi:hypothetical protein